jgi:toxin YoeB
VNLVFAPQAWEDYTYWQSTDPKMLGRIHLLLKDISRNPSDGIGKPAPLKHALRGYWSRRTDPEHRIVYKIVQDGIFIAQLRHHY